MTIKEKWEAIASLLNPGTQPALVEEMRRVFYAGVGAAWQAIIEETRTMGVKESVAKIDAVKYELDQHQKDLLAKRVIN